MGGKMYIVHEQQVRVVRVIASILSTPSKVSVVNGREVKTNLCLRCADLQIVFHMKSIFIQYIFCRNACKNCFLLIFTLTVSC